MNTHNKTKESVEKLKDIKLSDSSRNRIQNNLLEYARFHGVRVADDSRSIEQVSPVTARHTTFISNILNLQKKSMTAALIAIMLIAGGGTSLAAEGAVPGEFLYPVKIEVNENIQHAFAFSNEAEAKLNARLAEERLEEAEELASRGELTAEISADISARLKNHYEDATSRSDKAEAEGNYESSATVRASLEGTLRTYADVLSDLNVRVLGNEGSSLITNIRTYADSSAEAQATATIDVSADIKADVEKTIKRADNIISEVEVKLSRAKNELSAETYARLETKLAEATAAQAEAKASVRTESYRIAYTSAQTVVRIATEVSTMIDSMLRLQLNTDLGTDSLLDIQIETESKTETNTRTETNSETETNRTTDNSVDVEIDASSDTDVDTDVIDIQTDTSVRSGLNF